MVDLDWKNLGFSYRKTPYNIRYHYKDGKWDEGTLCDTDTLEMNIAACVFHYGQACFEGLKAFRNAAGEVRIFRPQANAKRLNDSLHYLLCPEIPEDLFVDACRRVVAANIDYVPPYESRGSLYIRPVVFGSAPQIGVGPSSEYEFIILVMPVGEYYKDGLHAVDAVILDQYDRAAPHGTGHIKAAGNYAAGLYSGKEGKKAGFPVVLFLDSATHTRVEEFSTSNFIGIHEDGTYVTPKSHSVLPSITNNSLQEIAKHFGMNVEYREVFEKELQTFSEVAACGTAVVITPIGNIVHNDTTYHYPAGCGPYLKKLFDMYQAIQYGDAEDIFGWMVCV